MSDGSSPRGRGTPFVFELCILILRFIPAWAGNTSHDNALWNTRPVHPRVGGEHDSQGWHPDPVTGSSPRGRGTRPPLCRMRHAERFIPAWAGNTKPQARHHACDPVHPRVGGEHDHSTETNNEHHGSSPRGRGTQMNSSNRDPGCRFIPAWAGNTAR